MSYLDICIHVHRSHALFFGDMDTGSIAVGQIILCSTVPKSQLYGMASSKWFDYKYIHVHMTQNLYIATFLPASWLRNRSDFDQLCLNINFIELQGHGCIYIYIYIYQMDCVCQRYNEECSTRTCADDCYNCWKKSKLKSYVRPWFHG